MPHRCVRCGTMYDDGAKEILKGCSCGAKLFFFVKKKDIRESEEAVEKLTEDDKIQMEKDAFDLIGIDPTQQDKAVILDFESINIMKPGKFEIDLVNLFNKDKPLVYKLEEGKYMIDLAQTFKKDLDKKK